MAEFDLVWCKSFSISKASNGGIHISASFLNLPGLIDNSSGKLLTMELNDSVTLFGFTFICTNATIDGIIKRVTLINKDSYLEKKLTHDISFRTVPKSLMNAAKLAIINNRTIPDIDNPDVELFIKESSTSLYGNGGWKCSDIFNELVNYFESNVTIPSNFNYDVSDVSFSTGSTMIQILQNLYPIPGMGAHYESDGSLVMTSSPTESEFNSFTSDISSCQTLSDNGTFKEFIYIIDGMQSSPEGVNNENCNSVITIESNLYKGIKSTLMWKIGLIYNLFGGIYGYAYKTQTVSSIDIRLILPKDQSLTEITKLNVVDHWNL